LRTLRFIFSLERNRKVFKRLFPPHVFELFIDVGHYAYELALYERLALACVELSTAERSGIDGALDEIDLAKGEAQRMVGEYAVVEMVGQGAFGCIYHARKGGLVYAIKELPIESYGKIDGGSPSQVEANVGTLHSEVEILSTLDHPNIVKCDCLGSAMRFHAVPADRRPSARRRVRLCRPAARCRTGVLQLRYSSTRVTPTLATRYYTSFVEKRKLYIVMELVDGVTLGSFLSDHANHSYGADSAAIGLPEKLIWQIFLQVRLPLPALVSSASFGCA
jgi:serine/threonine protein kinase